MKEKESFKFRAIKVDLIISKSHCVIFQGLLIRNTVKFRSVVREHRESECHKSKKICVPDQQYIFASSQWQ